MSKRSEACKISQATREIVLNRDKCCVICGNQGIPNAHITRRSQGGLGRADNVVTLCQTCHHDYDNGNKRWEIYDILVNYIKKFYPDWTKESVTYRKEY